jgi:5-(carboxyamino)imidazole ribonucleotide mutase
MSDNTKPIAIIMGSSSDLETMKPAAAILDDFGIGYTIQALSAHRTPAMVSEFSTTARERGVQAIIAAAGGAAHLAGVIAAHTTVPVIACPMPSMGLAGIDSLLSMVQMPKGIPVATMGIGKSGAANAALFAVAMLANTDADVCAKLDKFRADQAEAVIAKNDLSGKL